MTEDNSQNEFDNQGSKTPESHNYQNSCINSSKMGRPIKSEPQAGTQGYRMKILREAMGYQTQKAFADKLGISLSLWNQYERNEAPVSRINAKKIANQIPGLSTGWINEGSEGDLSKGMLIRLGLLPPGD
jgi:DNA-binding transcriptional regulator YiaG